MVSGKFARRVFAIAISSIKMSSDMNGTYLK